MSRAASGRVLFVVLILSLAVGGTASAEEHESALRPAQQASLAGGTFFSCAISGDGSVRCWGANVDGQLGNGVALPGSDSLSPASPVALGQPAKKIAAGAAHACAVLADATVRCWGAGFEGQLGAGGPLPGADTSTPVAVIGLGQPVASLAVGDAHSCAVLSGGAVRCWGRDDEGQLGDGTAGADTSTPSTAVALPQPAVTVAGGGFHTCAILADGSVHCWGLDNTGQLGNGAPFTDSPTPVTVVGLGQPARALALGTTFSCALLADGSVRCWGNDGGGQLGDGGPLAGSNNPVPAPAVALGQPAAAITAGAVHACALLHNGQIRCWGSDGVGQLGDGAGVSSTSSPSTAVTGFGGIPRAVTAGAIHNCALASDGEVRCWGGDLNGQLGDGDPAVNISEPSTPVNLPAAGPTETADLSLAAQASTSTASVGDTVTLTFTIANAGIDRSAATVAVPLASRLNLISATPSQGSYNRSTGIWTTGSLEPGPTGATLTLVGQAVAVGDATTTGELIDASALDIDSTPGNGVASEDDQAAATVSVAALDSRVAADALTLSLKPARDRRPPFAFTAGGRLVVTRAALRDACSGRITIRVRAGRRVVSTRRAALRLRNGDCRYTTRLKFRKHPRGARRLQVTASFPGNARLLARSSRAVTVRLG